MVQPFSHRQIKATMVSVLIITVAPVPMAAQRAVYYFRVARKIVLAVRVGTLICSESQSEKGSGNVELEQTQFLLVHSQSRQRSVT